MSSQPFSLSWLVSATIFGALFTTVVANDVLKTNGFTTCVDNSKIKVNALNIQFDRSTKQITFDVGGTSDEVQNVTASLVVSAYGNQVYQKDFNPCADDTKVIELCPGKQSSRVMSSYLKSLLGAYSPCRNIRSPRRAKCSRFLRWPDTFNRIHST